MKPTKFCRLLLPLTSLLTGGCMADNPNQDHTTPLYEGELKDTLLVGANDNAEVIVFLPDERKALLVSSKARKLTLLSVDGNTIEPLRSTTLFDGDPSDSELTHVAVSHQADWAALTRTIVTQNGDTVSDCDGEVLLVSLGDSTFGEILQQVPVGPMPDAIAISPDGTLVASANERDVVWGKCAGVADLPPGSVSLIDVSAGPETATEVKRILLGDTQSDREPESLTFSRDGGLLVVTLQDSHEVAFLDVPALLALESPTASDVVISQTPQNSLGADAWPDGVTAFEDESGQELYAVAGEANNVLSIFLPNGQMLTSFELFESDLPSDLPRGDWGQGTVFQIDSLASFVFESETYLAATLKSAGAVAVWQVTRPSDPHLAAVIQVGQEEGAAPYEESTVLPEGISATSAGLILTANEGESSVSLIAPVGGASR